MLRYLDDVVTLQLDVDVCNGCGMCVTVCPHTVFSIKDKKAIIADRNTCIECGACAINCPVNAIKVQTGAGCAAGILGAALGIDNCCAGECGVSPTGNESNQSNCCGSSSVGKTNNKSIRLTFSPTHQLNDKDKSKHFVIYETAACCSGSTCCTNTDKSLIELQDAIDKLEGMGATIDRYSITSSPGKFRDNPEVLKLVQEHKSEALPITTINGKVIKFGSYPTLNELTRYLS